MTLQDGRMKATRFLIEKQSGGIDELYDYWIEGKTQGVRPLPCSVIRDLLGWVD